MPEPHTQHRPSRRHAARRFAPFRLRGELDLATADEVRVQLWAYAATTEGEMVCDCRDLTFLDSSGIAMIIAVDDELRLRDRRLRLTNLTGTPRCALEICGLAERFGIPHTSAMPSLSGAAITVLRHMADQHPCTILRDAAAETGLSYATTSAALRELIEAGYVTQRPTSPTLADMFAITSSGRRTACRLR
jgi:anti-anti-sigma factor